MVELSFSRGFLAPKLTSPLGYSTSPFLCTYNVLGMIACDLDSAASGTEWLPPPSSPPEPRLLELDWRRPTGLQGSAWPCQCRAHNSGFPSSRPSPAARTGFGGVKTWVARPSLLPPLAGTLRAGFTGAIPVLCLHLSPLLTVRYILCGGVRAGEQ